MVSPKSRKRGSFRPMTPARIAPVCMPILNFFCQHKEVHSVFCEPQNAQKIPKLQKKEEQKQGTQMESHTQMEPRLCSVLELLDLIGRTEESQQQALVMLHRIGGVRRQVFRKNTHAGHIFLRHGLDLRDLPETSKPLRRLGNETTTCGPMTEPV